MSDLSVSEVTRRNILDALSLSPFDWSGRLDEQAFLWRIYDLDKLPSTDSRFSNAANDIWMHRLHFVDWSDDWVFSDTRFDLLGCPDERFLEFLCETIHPVVRSDVSEVDKMLDIYNANLKVDGWEIRQDGEISGRPIFGAKRIGQDSFISASMSSDLASRIDDKYVRKQIARLNSAMEIDPDLAIGTAKEFAETIAKTILQDRGVTFGENDDLPQLVKKACKELRLLPEDVPKYARGHDAIRILLSNLATIAKNMAEIRNLYGTGHGRSKGSGSLSARHAKLGVGAAVTLASFLFSTHLERD